MRYFHNLYGQFQISNQFALIAGFDIGAQQKEKASDDYDTWYTPVPVSYTHLDVYKRQDETPEGKSIIELAGINPLSYEVKNLSLIHI